MSQNKAIKITIDLDEGKSLVLMVDARAFIVEKENKTIDVSFIPPTLEEIREYAAEKGYDVDVEKIYNHYSASGWTGVQGKIVNWKAAVNSCNGNPKYRKKVII